MKTKLIEGLLDAPVKREGHRIYNASPVAVVREDSVIDHDERMDAERYRFDLVIGARFVALPPDPGGHARRQQHRLMIRTVTEHVYNEVRREMYELFPLAMDVNEYQLSQKIIAVAERVLDMTRPE